MKQLVVVRHGRYGYDDRLSDRGHAQIGTLAEKLKPLMHEATVLIFTSPTDRTRESAEILGAAFGVGFEEHEILWSDESHREDLPRALKLVRSHQDKADVLVLVTHYEYVEDFLEYYAREELGIKLHSRLIEMGEALVLDCLQKTLTYVV